MAKPKLGLSRLNAEEIVALATTIITRMTGNGNFTTPNPPLAVLTGLKTTAATAIADYNSAKAASDAALVARDVAIADLCSALTLEGTYVENASAGDPAKIESAGMSTRAIGTPQIMTQVLNLVLAAGDYEATLEARWQIVKGARSYEVQTSPDPMSASSWSYKMTATKGSAVISGLTSGTRLWVRVRAIGADNQPGPWSDPALKTVP